MFTKGGRGIYHVVPFVWTFLSTWIRHFCHIFERTFHTEIPILWKLIHPLYNHFNVPLKFGFHLKNTNIIPSIVVIPPTNFKMHIPPPVHNPSRVHSSSIYKYLNINSGQEMTVITGKTKTQIYIYFFPNSDILAISQWTTIKIFLVRSVHFQIYNKILEFAWTLKRLSQSSINIHFHVRKTFN